MILHLDMDAFFASVEQRDDPFLMGKPVIVGRSSARGVVAAASYEARTYGVASAMPMFKAKRLCPRGIIVPGRMARYKEVSADIISTLSEFSPLVEQISIDEAYLDISGLRSVFGQPEDIGLRIKEKIRQKVKLSCSVGIAPVKFLAKIASDMKKPDGLTIISADDMGHFIDALDIKKVPGVGTSMLRQLDAFGIRRLGDVKRFPEERLVKGLGTYGRRLVAFSKGIDGSPVTPYHQAKSISAENTLSRDTMDKKKLGVYLLRHAERVSRQLRGKKVKAGTVVLKLKTPDFKLVTRSRSLDAPTQSTDVIYQEARMLLDNFKLETNVRLIGVGVSGLLPEHHPVQMDLFEESGERSMGWEKVDRAIDGIVEKYGSQVVKRASTYKT